MRSTPAVPKGARESPTGSASFTLIELLMVVMVIGIVSAITLPTFVRSIRGNRLRMAARTIIMAGRYARNMAILNQREMIVELNPDRSQVAVRPVRNAMKDRDGEPTVTEPPFADDPPWLPAEDSDDEPDEDSEEAIPVDGESEIVRTLDRVKIVDVEILDEPGEDTEEPPDGTRQVLYSSNGQCTPYRVTIADEKDETVVVNFDRLGSVETERF